MNALELPTMSPARAGRLPWRTGRVAASGVGLLLAMLGCSEPPPDANREPARPGVQQRPGVRFDAASLREGDTVGELVAESIVVRQSTVDSTHVGTVVFRGRFQLSGHLMEHPEADLRRTEVCLEADSASAVRMPRWRHDERRPWFCFVNPAEARRALVRSDSATGVTLVIEEFTINRGLTDEVNSARFVGRLRK